MNQSPLSTPIPIPAEPIHKTEGDDWRLWIGNLDTRVTEYSLLKIIQKFGTLEKFDFLYHKVGPDAGKPRGYCFVSYKERQDEEDRVKEVNKDTDKGSEEMSAQAKIRAIEAKLRHMERTKEEMTLSSKPVVEPGTSIYSSAQKPAETGTSKYPTDERRKGSKPYSRNERRK